MLTKALESAEVLFQRQSLDPNTIQAQIQRLADAAQIKHNITRTVEEIDRMEVNLIFFRYTRERRRTVTALASDRAGPTATRETLYAVVRLPSWFLQQQWAVAVLRATTGWQYNLRIIRVLPYDANIFELCDEGNIERIGQLIESGEASIYDQMADGFTLLHAAAEARQTALCQYLLTLGAIPDALSTEEASKPHQDDSLWDR